MGIIAERSLWLEQLLRRVLVPEYKVPGEVIEQIVNASRERPREVLLLLDKIIDMPINKMVSVIKDFKTKDKMAKSFCKGFVRKQPRRRSACREK